MELEPRLRAFAAVAREGSFSRAAERLFISQPAVSRHVAGLEAELGQVLVMRGRHGASLTPTGVVLAEYVLRAEALLANAHRSIEASAQGETGRLSLVASGIPGTYVLPRLVAAFHRRHPAVEIDFELMTSASAIEAVRDHRAEIGCTGGLVVPPELEAEPLMEDEIVLAGEQSMAGRRLGRADLERLTWMSREEGSSTREAVEGARRRLGLHTVDRLALPSWEAVKLAVAAGEGITAISRLAIESELAAGRLVILDAPMWRLTRTIAAITARGVPLTPPAARFLQAIRDASTGTSVAVV